ncbi:MAG: hypothetical protein P1V97_15430, partial [Planctomycetota bacterium]|nr:hypothetical protein [Planctomycetota bacterium]
MKRSLSLTGPIYRAWSQCQNKTVKEQLNDGIRAFDLRIAQDKQGEFYCCHGLYGEKIEQVLKSVSDFARAYPKEIILLDFAKFYGWKSGPKGQDTAQNSISDLAHNSLKSRLLKQLGPRLLAPTVQGPSGPESTWEMTLAKIWKSQKSIIVHYRHGSAKTPFWRSKIQSSWANT